MSMTNHGMGVQQAILKLQGQRETQSAYEGMVRTHDFRIPVTKYGLIKDIHCEFAFLFVHQPVFSADFVLDNQAFVFPEYLPSVKASVVDWKIADGDTDKAANPTQYAPYFGAMVTATVGGHIYQKGFLHLSFTGRTIVAPIGDIRQNAFFTREEED